MIESFILAAVTTVQGIPPAVEWLPVLSTEEVQIEVARSSILRNSDDRTVEMVLRRSFKEPYQVSPTVTVSYSIESVFLICGLRSMVLSAQVGFDASNVKVYESTTSKLYIANGQPDHLPTLILAAACPSQPRSSPPKPSSPKSISVLNPTRVVYKLV